ncbi:hypothetical protein HY489_03600 [Candidatus Woesearchaeota archaeon]|nr:hypothetical protein [Candidatus Woesearchaeota archaeon]
MAISYYAIFFLLAGASLGYFANEITANVVLENDPCEVVSCTLGNRADLLDINDQGYAICKCPHEQKNYYILIARKY